MTKWRTTDTLRLARHGKFPRPEARRLISAKAGNVPHVINITVAD